ncbi:MAG: hypothetical protein A2452_10065 [Candidatus Firestonebacteria bacterium RIFOXYC2_FULL_39_67]|nr:MAG: hypothetical protein A2536_04510 [Candidatus Firestonebacteria bacterium RIFOXYD2_FULL_39_29]OGF57367.1 MAG: hypothetical protein A2452_10065 [Candidatus Firestonebacteria bacterium RIFOXYC2_FULL_39_67]
MRYIAFSHKIKQAIFAAVLVAFAPVFAGVSRPIDTISPAGLKENIRELVSYKSRVSGYPGCDKAADYILSEFRKAGLTGIKEFEFEVVVPVDKGAKLKINRSKKEIQIYSVWPNLARTSTLPPEGITGNIYYTGDADISNFNGKEIKGSIILADFNCDTKWLNAFMLGAKAVIFVEPDDTERREAENKFLGVPANLPRFFISKKEAAQFIGQKGDVSVTLTAKMTWEKRKSKNIIGYIEGSDAKLKSECMIINSYYDSMSIVPAVAPGAESACGISAFLEMAKYASKNRPGRTVAFLATSAHFEGLVGMREFLKYKFDDEFKTFKHCFLMSLDLSSQTDELGMTVSGHYYDLRDILARRFQNFTKAISETADSFKKDYLVDMLAAKQGRTWDSYIPDKISLEHEPAVLAKKIALSFVTLNDMRSKIDTTLDNIESVNISNLSKQVKFLAQLMYDLSFNELPFDIQKIEKNGADDCTGQVVEFDPRESFMANKPVHGAIVFLQRDYRPLAVSGVRDLMVLMTDEKGGFKVPYHPQHTRVNNSSYMYSFKAFKMDDSDGEIIYSKDLGRYGEDKFKTINILQNEPKFRTLVVCKAKSMTLFNIVDQRTYFQPVLINVFDAKTDSTPVEYSYFGHNPQAWNKSGSFAVSTIVIFGKENSRFKFNFGSGLIGTKSILINADEANPTGTGYLIKDNPMVYYTPFFVARDLWVLDEYRINLMKKFGISNDRLNELHKISKTSLDTASTSLSEKKYDKFIKASRESWGFEARAYPDVQGTANDVVKGILFYMMLVIPFVYFAERLLFGFSDIKKQISAIFGIFLVVFIILHFVHPAFSISTSPYIIFLAFIILMLGIIVISIVYSKFSVQMRELRAAITGVHQADISRMTTTATAFSLGISNIRKRPGRAILTSTTLILLTFATLSFTSVKSYIKFNKISLHNKASYEGLMVRSGNWDALEDSVYSQLKEHFKGVAKVAPRSWLISKYVRAIFNGKSYTTNALLGMTELDKEFVSANGMLKSGRWFKAGEMYSCVLPETMAKALGITEKDMDKASVDIWGKKLKVVGIINEEKFVNAKDIDDEIFTPANFSALQGIKQGSSNAGEEMSFPVMNHMQIQNVLLVPYELPIAWGGNLRSVRVEFNKNEPEVLKAEIEKLMPRLALTVFVGDKGEAYLYSSTGSNLYSGLGNLFIPLLIGAFIVLNTMLGSVYERIKEIGTYSAVGLAPSHISALFIAESAVYATIGAITGYLFGQTLSKIIADFHLLPGLMLNYSSMSAVGTCGIVIITVLLSTLYPAIKASQMAVPDVSRKWKFPKPDGDNMTFELPFTVNKKDVLGINGFLSNFFNFHTESSVGGFYTDKVIVSKNQDKEAYHLEMTVWIAPFELGISQLVKIDTMLTEDQNIFEIKFSIQRLSGELNTWERVNRGFLDSIRKQFLIWRTLSEQSKEKYIQEGVRSINENV